MLDLAFLTWERPLSTNFSINNKICRVAFNSISRISDKKLTRETTWLVHFFYYNHKWHISPKNRNFYQHLVNPLGNFLFFNPSGLKRHFQSVDYNLKTSFLVNPQQSENPDLYPKKLKSDLPFVIRVPTSAHPTSIFF